MSSTGHGAGFQTVRFASALFRDSEPLWCLPACCFFIVSVKFRKVFLFPCPSLLVFVMHVWTLTSIYEYGQEHLLLEQLTCLPLSRLDLNPRHGSILRQKAHHLADQYDHHSTQHDHSGLCIRNLWRASVPVHRVLITSGRSSVERPDCSSSASREVTASHMSPGGSCTRWRGLRSKRIGDSDAGS